MFFPYSMGFSIATAFTAIFPERVERLVGIDMISRPLLAKELPVVMAKIVTGFHRAMNRSHNAMTYQAAKEKMLQQYNNSIDGDEADVLLARGLKKIDGKEDQFEFTWDPRTAVSGFTFTMTEEQIREMIRKIRCPVLVIKASNGIIKAMLSKEIEKRICDMYSQSSVDFRLVEVEGRHHLHIGHPERVAPHIIDFFNSSKSNL